MGSAQLALLEGLSDQRADQSRAIVERQRSQLMLIEKQHVELKSITQEYQDMPAEAVAVTPRLLAHRRAFVAQLTDELGALSEQREQQSLILQQHIVEHRQRTAQTAAISAIHEKHRRIESDLSARREQHQQEESHRAVSAGAGPEAVMDAGNE